MNDSQNYIDLLSRLKGAYVCAVHSFVGLKDGGKCLLLNGQVRFETTSKALEDAPFQFETEHIFAKRFVKAATTDDISAAVAKAAKTGGMECQDDVVSLPSDSGQFSEYLDTYTHPFAPRLLIRGQSRHNLLVGLKVSNLLESELKAADTPFDSMDELLSCYGLPTLNQTGDQVALQFIAAPPGEIDARSTITNGEATIEFRKAKGMPADKFKIGWTFRGEDKMVRDSAVSGALKWREENGAMIGTHRLSVGSAPALVAYLSFEGVFLEQRVVSDPKKHLNPRYEVQQVFDPGLQLLREWLLTPETVSDKGKVFEFAVSTLFALLGFSVQNYCRIPKLQDGSDIVAFGTSGQIAVIECTVGLLNQKDKLAKLTYRTQQIRAKLTTAGCDLSVLQAVIVTPLSRAEAKAGILSAESLGIAVVCKEDLEYLIALIPSPPDVERRIKDLTGFVPISSHVGSYGGT